MKSLYFDKSSKELVFPDLSALPERLVYKRVSSLRAFFDSLSDSSLGGNDAVGVAAAFVLCAEAYRFEDGKPEGFSYSFSRSVDFVVRQCASYPSVVAACEEMRHVCEGLSSTDEMLASVVKAARGIENRTSGYCGKLAGNGAKLISDGDGVLVRGNCGVLSSVKHGVSLEAVYTASKDRNVKLYIGETYPSLEGRRIAAFEAESNGLHAEIISDDSAASLMANGKINKIFLDVGFDRDGNLCSSSGSLMLASASRYFGVALCAFVNAFRSWNGEKRDILKKEMFDHVISNNGKEWKI